jgi:histidine triad (HIT) family protein
MDSIFTKIINREIPAYIIEENEDFIAFLDVFPLAKGHTLVIPKKQVDYIFDLDEETHTALWKFAKQISVRVNEAIECKRIGVAVIGLEVPHAHIHLVPLNNVEDINFSRPKLTLTDLEFIAIHQRILKA